MLILRQVHARHWETLWLSGLGGILSVSLGCRGCRLKLAINKLEGSRLGCRTDES